MKSIPVLVAGVRCLRTRDEKSSAEASQLQTKRSLSEIVALTNAPAKIQGG